jgi:pyrroline-5-carboxylate reductase
MAVHQIGFIGAGRMATALAQGLLSAQLAKRETLLASDPSPVAVERFAEATGCRALNNNPELALACDVIFLAVKPQQISAVVHELRESLTSRHLVVSIAAGVTLDRLSSGLGKEPRLVRVMPNTPCLVGEGASAYCLGTSATPADGELVTQLLESVGRAFELPESLLDAVTGLSGSGPAFVYQVIEALSDGGVRMGLPREVATALAAQTVRGAAEMVLVTGEHPAVLKDQVTSPGGTTIAGLQALEAGGLRAALISAVEAATRRSTELAGTK